ncbi:hypothetical protein V5O48_001695 [Marasmius crinis-equi]|uniref:Uncharacterized protein n=1 Tax=Marasmius crinis-equi TaxID=585013 RepID=A0ABR3FYC0_9AGAR
MSAGPLRKRPVFGDISKDNPKLIDGLKVSSEQGPPTSLAAPSSLFKSSRFNLLLGAVAQEERTTVPKSRRNLLDSKREEGAAGEAGGPCSDEILWPFVSLGLSWKTFPDTAREQRRFGRTVRGTGFPVPRGGDGGCQSHPPTSPPRHLHGHVRVPPLSPLASHNYIRTDTPDLGSTRPHARSYRYAYDTPGSKNTSDQIEFVTRRLSTEGPRANLEKFTGFHTTCRQQHQSHPPPSSTTSRYASFRIRGAEFDYHLKQRLRQPRRDRYNRDRRVVELTSPLLSHPLAPQEVGLLGSQAAAADYERREQDVVAMSQVRYARHDRSDRHHHRRRLERVFPRPYKKSIYEDYNPHVHGAEDRGTDISDEFSFGHMLEFSKLAVAFAVELDGWEQDV